MPNTENTTTEQFTDDEMLFRQVHPSFIQNERVTSQAFNPTPKDEEKLSVSRSLKTNAETAYLHHTQTLQLESAGVWAVQVQEVQESLTPPPTRIVPDPVVTPHPDPSHTLIDFSSLTRSGRDSIAKKLATKARDRGRQHPPRQDI